MQWRKTKQYIKQRIKIYIKKERCSPSTIIIVKYGKVIYSADVKGEGGNDHFSLFSSAQETPLHCGFVSKDFFLKNIRKFYNPVSNRLNVKIMF